NNPINLTDANGECPVCPFIIGAIIGGIMAGEASDWDFNAVLKGMVIGGISGGVGAAAGAAFASSYAASLGGAAGFVGGAIGGSVSSVISTMAFNPGADLFGAAARGALMGAIGHGVGHGPFGGALITGAVSTALYGGNYWENVGWAAASAAVSAGVDMADISGEDIDPRKGQGASPVSGKSEARLYRPGTLRDRIGFMLLGSAYSHVALAFEGGRIADASTGSFTDGTKGVSGLFDSKSGGQRWVELKDRPYRVVKLNQDFSATAAATRLPYGLGFLFGTGAVCTTYASLVTGNLVTGITPGQMYWNAQPYRPYNSNWARPR
ncbi:MAG: hypothetical protein K8L99_16380, partial [Anaerolineae bacterium]|nr:hypothetical protein [Anaerolineae bacterium]